MNVYVFLNQLLGPNIARVSSDLGCSFFGQTQLGGVCSYIIYIRNIWERRDLARIMLSKNTLERVGGIGLSCFMLVFSPVNLVVMKVRLCQGVGHWDTGTLGQQSHEEDVRMLFSISVFS